MKRFFLVILYLTISLALSGQMKDWFNKISETEPYVKGVNTMTDPSQIAINTMGGYVETFINTFGILEYHNVLEAIETGTLDKYTEHLRYLVANGLKEADYIKKMMWGMNGSKLYFVRNNKLFVITYDPKEGPDNYESLYLYRRDDDGWKPASNLIRKDAYHEGKFMLRFDSRTTRWNAQDTLFTLENLCYGSVNKISSGSVFVTYNTEVWYPAGNGYNYNSILVLVPHDKETYTATVFEPANKKGKVVKNITSYYNTWGSKENNYKVVWHKSIGPAMFPLLFGTRNTDYKEVDGFGLTIKYVDGTIDNPIEAGTLNFTIADDSVTYNGTIELQRIK